MANAETEKRLAELVDEITGTLRRLYPDMSDTIDRAAPMTLRSGQDWEHDPWERVILSMVAQMGRTALGLPFDAKDDSESERRRFALHRDARHEWHRRTKPWLDVGRSQARTHPSAFSRRGGGE